MIIYNITVNIEPQIDKEWKQWASTTFIPYMFDTGIFQDALLSKVDTPDDIEGITYSIQFSCISNEMLDAYHKTYFQKTQALLDTYKNKYVYFDTKLEVLEKVYAPQS